MLHLFEVKREALLFARDSLVNQLESRLKEKSSPEIQKILRPKRVKFLFV